MLANAYEGNDVHEEAICERKSVVEQLQWIVQDLPGDLGTSNFELQEVSCTDSLTGLWNRRMSTTNFDWFYW